MRSAFKSSEIRPCFCGLQSVFVFSLIERWLRPLTVLSTLHFFFCRSEHFWNSSVFGSLRFQLELCLRLRLFTDSTGMCFRDTELRIWKQSNVPDLNYLGNFWPWLKFKYLIHTYSRLCISITGLQYRVMKYVTMIYKKETRQALLSMNLIEEKIFSAWRQALANHMVT